MDIVLLRNKTLLPIEVKFKSRIDKKELKGLLSFMDKYKCKNGIVVTKNSLDSIEYNGKKIQLMPVWLFLLANPS